MFDPRVPERLQGPLVGVIAVLLAMSTTSAAVVDRASGRVDAIREGLGVAVRPVADPAGGTGLGAGGALLAPVDPSGSVSGAVGGPVQNAAATPLGVAMVPAAGVYRYEVATTVGAETSVQEEQREIAVISGDRTTGTVEVSARLAGESQVSMIDWSPVGAFVRTTRIESDSGTGRDCTWSPPFPDIGALVAGATWTLDSTCRTPVGGIDTTFRITGTGRVVGEATVVLGAEQVRVWQIARDRNTDIEATLGTQSLRQQAREVGSLFLDPVRGVVIRSDVVVTLTGSQEGVTRRVSVLQP